ncbi:MAG: WxL protein peptidoglycan domain-containing protein [Actinomycetota bacterium]|nr:DUF916 domain-containing protein [Actinomycetota bacterium]
MKLGIRPVEVAGPYFDLAMKPGEHRVITVELGNFGTETVTAASFDADAYTIINGGFAAKLRGEPTSGSTLWLDYPDQEIELHPQQTIRRTVSISVPADATPGQHLSALVIQNARVLKGSGSIAIDQFQRQAIAVVITIPGERRLALDFGKAKHKVANSRSVVQVELNNSGNFLLKPSGPWLLRDSKGIEVSKTTVEMDSFYAGTSTQVEVPLESLLKPGHYTVSVDLKDRETGFKRSSGPLPFDVDAGSVSGTSPRTDGRQFVEVDQSSGSGIPWWAVAGGGVLLLLFLLVLLLLLVLLRRRKEEEQDR